MVTRHVVPDTVSHPDQPAKSTAGAAVSVTTVSMVNDAAQLAPQLIPSGLDVTVPWSAARPDLPTVSVKRCSSKTTVTVRAALTDTVQVAPATESQPTQPA